MSAIGRNRAGVSEMNTIVDQLYNKMNPVHKEHNAKLQVKYNADIQALVETKSQDFQDLWNYLKNYRRTDIVNFLDSDGLLQPEEIEVNGDLFETIRTVASNHYSAKDVEGSNKKIKEDLLKIYKL